MKLLKLKSNYKLAKAGGLSNSTVANWLNGETKPDTAKLERLANNLGISKEWLIYGKGNVEVQIDDESLEVIQEDQTIDLVNSLREYLPKDKQEDLDIIINEYKAAIAWKAKFARAQKALDKYKASL